MKRKLSIALAIAASIELTANLSLAQSKSLPSIAPSPKQSNSLTEERVKKILEEEISRKDAARVQSDADRNVTTTTTWVQVLLGGISLLAGAMAILLATIALAPILIGTLLWIFRKNIFGQLNAEAKAEVQEQVERQLTKQIDVEVQNQISQFIERVKALNQKAQQLEAKVPISTKVDISSEKLNEIDDLSQSIEGFKDLLPLLSSLAEYYFKQGNISYFKNHYNEAVKLYDEALRYKPDNVNAWLNRGFALDELDQREEAIDSYNKALVYDPDNSNCLYNRGVVLSKLDRHEEAVASYDRALNKKPDDCEAWTNRGCALDALNRNEEAIESYEKALEYEDPATTRIAGVNLGDTLLKLGRYQEAIKASDQVITLIPEEACAWYNKSCAKSRLKEIDQSIENLQKAIALDPSYREKAQTDPDFDTIRNDDRFQRLLASDNQS
jgi:tetratricopeptide (TPR) repeat protein